MWEGFKNVYTVFGRRGVNGGGCLRKLKHGIQGVQKGSTFCFKGVNMEFSKVLRVFE